MTVSLVPDDPITDEAIALILHEEGFAGHPYWPGGLSGVTLDYGYDLGRKTLPVFRTHWAHLLPAEDFAALVPALGVRGSGAAQLLEAHALTRIAITRAMAQHVFRLDSLPDYEAQTFDAFPGVLGLPRDVIGSLTSLVYNRGPAMADDPRDPNHRRRLEMREIRSAIAAHQATQLPGTRRAAILAIATALEEMGARLWPGPPFATDLDHVLHDRRFREAAMVRRAAA